MSRLLWTEAEAAAMDRAIAAYEWWNLMPEGRHISPTGHAIREWMGDGRQRHNQLVMTLCGRGGCAGWAEQERSDAAPSERCGNCLDVIYAKARAK